MSHPSNIVRYLLIMLLFASSLSGFGQEGLEMTVKFKVDKGSLEGAKIIITKNSKPYKTLTPNRQRIVLDLKFGFEYLFTFIKPGYITKRIAISTKAPAKRMEDGFLPYAFNITLFKQYDGVNTVVFNQPVGIIRYDPEADDFDYDTDYTKSIRYVN